MNAPTPVRKVLSRLFFYVFVIFIGAFFALPMLWLVFAPFSETPSLAARPPTDFTFENFTEIFANPFAASSFVNSIILAAGTTFLVVVAAALCSYALSRVRLPGRDIMLYMLLLFSSVVTGTAAMVPLFQLVLQMGLINTHVGVVLVLTGGLLPAGIFILKDFMDSVPASYEESARMFGASSFRVLTEIVLPIVRPGLAVIAIWTIVNVWGNFLIPFILIRGQDLAPSAVVMFNFYTEGGQANLKLISAYSLLYSIPVVAMYAFVNWRYGFRFFGGIKR